MRLKQALEAPGGLVKMRSAEPHPPDFQITGGDHWFVFVLFTLRLARSHFPDQELILGHGSDSPAS